MLRAEEVSLAHIEKCCARLQKKQADYPPILYKTDLSEVLTGFERKELWWLPQPEAEEKDNGASLQHCMSRFRFLP